jgi:TRAP-type C4-dicarboxylate transport system substrate-binding protein
VLTLNAAAAAAVVGAAVLLVAGCASGTKSGGTAQHQIRLVMQTPDAPDSDAEYFIEQVAKRTGGRIRIIEGTGYSSVNPDNEARLVRALRSGNVQMAYIPSRAWERASSVRSFRALQAPFLVTDYAVLHRIAIGQIGHTMLASLGRIGLVGLGLVPHELRRLLGRTPLDSPAALRGARIRVVTSPTSVLALRALGVVPLTNFTSRDVGPALRSGRLDGIESDTNAIANNGYAHDARYLSANVALFVKTETIVIRKSAFDKLSSGDQAALRAAAAATVAHADPAAQERNEVRQLCGLGIRLVRAPPPALASLHREAAPVDAVLERDPSTRAAILAIQRLQSEAGGQAAALPACVGSGQSQSSSSNAALAGTYVMSATASEVASAPCRCGAPSPTNNWGSFRLVLQDGRFQISDQRSSGALIQGATNGSTTGTYAIHGDRITFTTQTGSGDTPLGAPGDQPVICRWSVYRNALTFRQLAVTAQAAARARGLDPAGPPALYVKPWQRIS